MNIFNILLFLIPIVSLIKADLLIIMVIFLWLSTFGEWIILIKQKYFSKNKDSIEIINPISNNLCFIVIIFILYQFLSLLFFNSNSYTFFIINIKKLILECLNFLLCLSILFILANAKTKEWWNKSIYYFSIGIFFASIFYVVDSILLNNVSSFLINGLTIKAKELQNYGQEILIIISWPIIGNYVIQEKKKELKLMILALSIVVFFPSKNGFNYSAIISFVFGFLVFLFFLLYRKRLLIISVVIFSFLISFTPLFFYFVDDSLLYRIVQNSSNSILHKLCMWHYYAQKLLNNIIFGNGFNVTEKLEILETINCNVIPYFKKVDSSLVANISNGYSFGLQLLIELGLVGFVLFFILGIRIILTINKKKSLPLNRQTVAVLLKQNKLESSLLATFFSFIIFITISSNIFTTWLFSVVLLVIVLCNITIINYNHTK